jgi:hypothetical protein
MSSSSRTAETPVIGTDTNLTPFTPPDGWFSQVRSLLGVPCDDCEERPATLTVTWPDRRWRVCRACVPASLLPVAEPLDDDEVLESVVEQLQLLADEMRRRSELTATQSTTNGAPTADGEVLLLVDEYALVLAQQSEQGHHDHAKSATNEAQLQDLIEMGRAARILTDGPASGG